MAVGARTRKQTGNRNTLDPDTRTGRTVRARIRNVLRTNHLTNHPPQIVHSRRSVPVCTERRTQYPCLRL
jgi:hypothetical protein